MSFSPLTSPELKAFTQTQIATFKTKRRTSCLLLAHSGLFDRARCMSAIEGKADIPDALADVC
jgi:hypothetical protein